MTNFVSSTGFPKIWRRAVQGALNADLSTAARLQHQKFSSLDDVPAGSRLGIKLKAALIYLPWHMMVSSLPTFKSFHIPMEAAAPPGEINLDKQTIENAYHGTVQWLKSSGIQSAEEGIELAGAVHAWFDPLKGKYAFPYPEITGYYMTWCIFQFNETQDRHYLTMAQKAASWIQNQAMHAEEGGIWNRVPDPQTPPSKRYLYTFDTGMVLTGLVNLYQFSGDEAYLQTAERALHFLLQRARRDDGLFHARFDPALKQVADEKPHWSSVPGCWETKLAIPLLLFSRAKRNVQAETAAFQVCDRLLRFQRQDGIFTMDPHSKFVYSHETCYAAEGLAVVGLLAKRPHYVAAARKAFLALLSRQLPGGGIARHSVGSELSVSETNDVSAQVLRLGALFASLIKGLDAADIVKLNNLLRRLIATQSWSEVTMQNGGIPYGVDMEERSRPHLNAWATMFSSQAFSIWSGLIEPQKLFASGLLV